MGQRAKPIGHSLDEQCPSDHSRCDPPGAPRGAALRRGNRASDRGGCASGSHRLASITMTLHDARPPSASEPGATSDGSYDVLIIGAGQAGLTVGYYLKQAGFRFLIVDAADQVGSAWAKRWDSLVLFTPRRYNAMPGLRFDGDPDQEPTRDEVIDYLHRYATELELPVQLSSRVSALDRRD